MPRHMDVMKGGIKANDQTMKTGKHVTNRARLAKTVSAAIRVDFLINRFDEAIQALAKQIRRSNISGVKVQLAQKKLRAFSDELWVSVYRAAQRLGKKSQDEKATFRVTWTKFDKKARAISKAATLASVEKIDVPGFFMFLSGLIETACPKEKVKRALFIEYFLHTCGFINEIPKITPDLHDVIKMAILAPQNGVIDLERGLKELSDCLIALSDEGKDFARAKLSDELPHLSLGKSVRVAVREFQDELANELLKNLEIPTLDVAAGLAGRKAKQNWVQETFNLAEKDAREVRRDIVWYKVFKWWNSIVEDRTIREVSIFGDTVEEDGNNLKQSAIHVRTVNIGDNPTIRTSDKAERIAKEWVWTRDITTTEFRGN